MGRKPGIKKQIVDCDEANTIFDAILDFTKQVVRLLKAPTDEALELFNAVLDTLRGTLKASVKFITNEVMVRITSALMNAAVLLTNIASRSIVPVGEVALDVITNAL